MQSKFSIETLENRTFLSASPISAGVIGETSGVMASAKAKATAAPEISITQRTMYFNTVQGQTQTQVLRITNNGSANLDLVAGSVALKGAARRNFTVNFPEGGFSVKPGRRLDLEITFRSPVGEAVEVKVARLTIVTNDPATPAVSVGLRGLPTTGIGGSNEPSLARVLETFNLPTNVGDASPAEYQLGTPVAGNDEVKVQQLVKAGPGAVSIRPLAVFGTDNGPAVRLGTYTPGMPDSLKPLWYVPREDAQSVAPKVYGQTLIDPGDAPFGIFAEFPGFTNTNGMARNVYSEDGLNTVWEPKTDQLRKMRFYPFVDQQGNAAPNTYLVAVEEFTAEYDYQDVVFIVTNVKPLSAVADVPVLSVSNFAGAPTNDRLVFNKVEIPDTAYPNITRLQNTVRLTNSGTADLIVTVKTTGNFTIDRGGGTNVVMTAGTTRDVQVRFTATSGSTHSGTLVITSNDPDHATVTITLKGFWQQYSEFNPSNRRSVEPNARQIVQDIFGYTTNLTYDGQGINGGGRVLATGDEVLSPYWKAADDGPVKMTLLAAYHGQTYVDTRTGNTLPAQSFAGWYEKGKAPLTSGRASVLKHGKGDGQMILPRHENAKISAYAAGQFNPGDKSFGFIIEGKEVSDPKLNPDPQGRTGFGHFVRFWPAYDGEGKLIPNTYLMLHDYNREFTNYDYNDNVFLVQNIVPENALKSPLTVFTEETSRGARISFTSPATGPKIIGFNVYRSTTPRGGYQLLTDTPLARRPVTTFVDETVTADQTFYYQITSLGGGGVESQPVTVRV